LDTPSSSIHKLINVFNLRTLLSCHHGMAGLQVADGEDYLLVWRAVMNKVNKQPQRADKGWSFSLVVGCETDNLSPKKVTRMLSKS